MKKWQLLDSDTTPDGETIALYEHDGTYAIRVAGQELMSTRQHASEERLAELACSPVAARPRTRVLIGGLGFGFTLQAALRVLPSTAAVVVAELMPAVVRWNRDPARPFAAAALGDPRVRLVEGDVVELLRREPGGFDAIMLDVDNGPAALSHSGNRALYDPTGLMGLHAALRAGGVVAFWSAAAAPLFAKALGKAGFKVETHRARAHTTGGSWHTIYLGRAGRV